MEDIILAQSGDKKARYRVILENQGLVKKIAFKYMCDGVDVDDLIQEGELALMKAINMFDINKDAKFSTYAYVCITRSIREFVSRQFKCIHVTDHAYRILSKYNEAFKVLSISLERIPTLEEIADYLNISSSFLTTILSSLNDSISLDGILEDFPNIFVENMYGDSVCDPMFECEYKDFFDKLHFVIYNSSLTDRQIQVLNLRYGLDGSGFKSLDEVGKILGISRQSVRDSELGAFKKIRNSNYISCLDGYEGFIK